MLGKRPDTPAPRLLRVDRSARPGWKTGREQPPDPGQLVYCTEGMAEVVRVVGKTGDGSRLLELRLLEKEAPPFYAAASNVLVMPPEGANGAGGAGAGHVAPEAAAVAGDGGAPRAPGGTTEWPAAASAAVHVGDGAAARSPGEEPLPGSRTASPSVFLDSSWALKGSFVPGSEPLPGSLVIPGPTPSGESAERVLPPAAAPAAPDSASAGADAAASLDSEVSGERAAPADSAEAEHVSASHDDAADDDSASLYIIGTPHGPGPRPDDLIGLPPEPGKQPPTIPLDPRVHWIR